MYSGQDGGKVGALDTTRRGLRQVIERAAVNRTVDAGQRSALILAPHPDDETLGCGALIARKVASGASVTVVVVTDGRHSHASPFLSPSELATLRRSEMREAAARLGLRPQAVMWLDLEDGTVSDREGFLVDTLRELNRTLAFDEVYATSAWEPHPDHAAVGRAARAAFGGRKSLWEYPVWLWASWPLTHGRRVASFWDAAQVLLLRRAARVSADDYLAIKTHALHAHSSQIARPAVIPADHPWPGLPATVLTSAAAPYEMFLRVR